MSSKPSKQLGALLGRVPPATVSGQSAHRSASVPYAPEQRSALTVEPPVPPAPVTEPEVPLQVLVPRHVRIQLDRMHAETRKPLRVLALEALRGIGIHVTEEDIAGKRGRKKS
jgi:hypothetical protein